MVSKSPNWGCSPSKWPFMAYKWGWSKVPLKNSDGGFSTFKGGPKKPVTSRVLITPLIWSNFGDLTRPGPPNGGLVLTQIQNASASHFSGDPSQHRLVSKTCAALEYIQQHVGLFDARTGRHSYNVNAASAVWQSLCVAGEAHAEADSSQPSTGAFYFQSACNDGFLFFQLQSLSCHPAALIGSRLALPWHPPVRHLGFGCRPTATLRHTRG